MNRSIKYNKKARHTSINTVIYVAQHYVDLIIKKHCKLYEQFFVALFNL